MIYTIGHGARTAQELFDLLNAAGVKRVVDVRSRPYSKRHPQFNRESVALFAKQRGILYVSAPRWGGIPVCIPAGIENFVRDGDCLMCSERNPAECHRGTVLTPYLEAKGFSITHLGVAVEATLF